MLNAQLVEEIDERFCNDRSDALHRCKLGVRIRACCNTPKLLDRAEALQQILGGDDADVPNTEAEQEARPIRLTLGLDRASTRPG